VDDGSTNPCSRETLAGVLGPDIELRLLRHATPLGGYAAKNAGAAAAATEFAYFLDDDDLLAPDFVQSVEAAMAGHPEIDVLFVGVEAFGPGAGQAQVAIDSAMERLFRETRWSGAANSTILFPSGLSDHLLKSVPMAFQRPVFRRSAWRQLGGFRQLPTWWEGEWAIRASLTRQVGLLNRPLSRWRIAGQGFFTGRDTQRTMLRVEVDIKEGLLLDRTLAGTNVPALKRAAAQAQADYANFLLSTPGCRREGISRAARAFRLQPGYRMARRIAGSLLRGILAKPAVG
jgi:glycosyltransferase involved in cell wall biosynthesis